MSTQAEHSMFPAAAPSIADRQTNGFADRCETPHSGDRAVHSGRCDSPHVAGSVRECNLVALSGVYARTRRSGTSVVFGRGISVMVEGSAIARVG
jgi:hypothetical protein